MKRESQNIERGETENGAQLILIGGLVIAVAVIAIALVIGGGIFSQSTNDDGGLSSFTSQMSDQIQAAEQVGEQDIEYVNENSTLFQGAYPDEICGEIADKAAVQQLVSTQLGEGESVTNIEVVEDCSNNELKGSSWLVGQTNPGYQLPSVNASNPGGRNPVDVVFAIDTTGSMGNAGKLGFTKDGAKAAIEDLTEEDQVGLVEYNTNLGNFLFGIFYQDGGAEDVVGGIKKLDSGWKTTVESGINGLSAGGGTDITTGLDEAKDVLDSGARSDPDVTQHIVLMTDGEHNEDSDEFANPAPEDYIDANEGDYSDTFVHTVGLTNDLSDIDSGVLEEIANKDGADSSVRPEGTFIQSDNPSDAEDIFEDVVDDIQATTEDSSTGEVDEIQDIRMNVSDFQGNGTYLMEFNNGSDVIWQMEVDNKFISPDLSPNGYEVEFRSEVNSSLDKTIEVSDSKGNLSESDNYVWLDLTDRDDTKPRLDVGGLSTSDTKSQLNRTPNTYIQDAWEEVQNETDNGGVNTVLNHTGPNGPDNPPPGRGKVKGTFAIEFEPKNGNFTQINQIDGGNFTDDCDTANATDLPSRCGLNDSGDREAVSTTRVNELDLLVTVKGPEGVSNRTITVSPQEELDIFEE